MDGGVRRDQAFCGKSNIGLSIWQYEDMNTVLYPAFTGSEFLAPKYTLVSTVDSSVHLFSLLRHSHEVRKFRGQRGYVILEGITGTWSI